MLIKHNPTFPDTKGRLVRLAQKLIDRCIFVMFCEDMGEQLSFPPNALRDYLSELSKSTTFEVDEQDAWNKLKELFHAMNEGKKFRSRPINRFNGGLFAADDALDGLVIPNEAFCAKLQGENDETLAAHKLTLLYFAGSYNFGAAGREGQAITLYTLGRIFEQSITELEALEAAKEDRQSLTIISKRKRDGVYYTPEWVVERVVAETLGPRLDEIRVEVGWSFDLEGDEEAIAKQVAREPSKRSDAFTKHTKAVRAFRDRLDAFTVLDPACGSGAFLIHTLEYLLRERRRVQRELALVTGGKREELFEFKVTMKSGIFCLRTFSAWTSTPRQWRSLGLPYGFTPQNPTSRFPTSTRTLWRVIRSSARRYTISRKTCCRHSRQKGNHQSLRLRDALPDSLRQNTRRRCRL